VKRADDSPEFLDGPLDLDLLRGNLRDLKRVNRWLGGSRLSVDAVRPFVVGAPDKTQVTLLDVGTGAADIPRALVRSTRRGRGGTLALTATDVRPEIVDLARESAARTGIEVREARLEDEADDSFDIVHASLVLHHLDRDAAVAFLGDARRVAREQVVINDLSRGWLWFAGAWLMTRLLTRNPYTRNDAPLSVRRAYTPDEVVAMAHEVGLRLVAHYRAFPGYRYALVFIRADHGG
jgi:2-polyprenyl-3-methyl-5-hydroxy-6-metoxy-1,4-benzoquinol methylase